MTGALAVADRLVDALNAHDLDALVALFEPDYRSEQPAHPARAFTGADQVRTNWSALFAAIPDIRWDVLRRAADDEAAWLEARVSGTRGDGSTLDERGVVIAGVRGDRVAWARFYLEEVEEDGGDITATIRDWTGESR